MSVLISTFKHAAVYGSVAILGKVLGFMMLPFYAHALRDIGYGVIGLFDASLTFLMSLLGWGIVRALTRFYHEESADHKLETISTGIYLATGVGTVLVTVALIFSRPLAVLLTGDATYQVIFCLALLGFLLNLIGQTASSYLLIRRHSLAFSLVRLTRLIVSLSLNIYLIVILKMGLLGYFLADLSAAAIACLIYVTIATKKCGRTFNKRIAINIIKFQLPLVPSSLVSWVSLQIERILVRSQLGLGTVGVLEMGYRFPALISTFLVGSIMNSWDTKRNEIAENGSVGDSSAAEVIGGMYTYILYLMVFAGLVLAVDIKLILFILTPQEFWQAYMIARVEIMTTIFFGSFLNLSFGLYFTKNTGTVAKIRVIMAVIKVGLSFLFIYRYGISGAAWSACIVAFVTLVWVTYESQKKFYVCIEYKKIAAIIAGAALLFVALDVVDVVAIPPGSWITENAVPAIDDVIEGSKLGTWKDGKILNIWNEKSNAVGLPAEQAHQEG